jgi:hypothetical protein
MEITKDNFSDLFESGNFYYFNSKLISDYYLTSENLNYIAHGHYNIVFEFLGTDGMKEGFRPLIFRVSNTPFYKYKYEISPKDGKTGKTGTLEKLRRYLPSFLPEPESVPEPDPEPSKRLAEQELKKKQTNKTYTELKEQIEAEIKQIEAEIRQIEAEIRQIKELQEKPTNSNGEIEQLEEKKKNLLKQIGDSVPLFFKEDDKSHGRAYLEHLSKEKIIPELISMGFFVLLLDGYFCFYEYSISEKGIVLLDFLEDPKLTEDDIKSLCKGIQDILTELVKLQIEFDIKVSNFVVVKDLSGTEPKYVPRIIDVEISQISQSSGLASSLPSIELKLSEMFTELTSIEDIHTFIVMFQLFQLSLNFKHANHKKLEDFTILSKKNIDWYLNLWENNKINIISKYIENMLFYFYFFFSTFYIFIFTKKQENKVFIMNEMTYPNCFNNYRYYLKHLIDNNFNTEDFKYYYNKPLKAPVPVVNNGGSRTKKTKRVRKNKKRKNKSKKRKLII